jgi:hypothetical protein
MVDGQKRDRQHGNELAAFHHEEFSTGRSIKSTAQWWRRQRQSSIRVADDMSARQ